jgi:hypothetical protein
MTDPLDDSIEKIRRAVLGDRYEAPAPREKTFEDYKREALEEQRKKSAKPAQPSMSDFAAAEREKLRPKIQRTELILDQAAAHGYGSEQRRRS